MSSILLALVAAIIGATFCFVGYRVFLVMLPIWGFFGGFWMGAMGTSLLLGSGFLGTAAGFVVGFVVGLIGALLSYLYYIAGLSIVAAAVGGAIAAGIMGALGFAPGFISAIVTLLSALAAVGLTLLLNLQKYVIIILMSMEGGTLVVLGGMLLAGQITILDLQARTNFLQPIFEGYWYWGVVWLVLVAAGIVVQLRTNRTYAFSKEMLAEGWG